jgi:hypothetical protein
MGFQDQDPETFDTDLVQPQYRAIQETKTLAFGGTRMIDYDMAKDMVYHFGKSLPRHPNGMTFSVFSKSGDLLATNTYFSIGGGFVVNEAAAAGGENLYYKQVKKEDASEARRTAGSTPADPKPSLLARAPAAPAKPAANLATTSSSDKPPLLFWSAASLLDICRKENMTIAQVVWENERRVSLLSDAEIRSKLLRLWSVMDECIHKVCCNDRLACLAKTGCRA